MGEVWLGRDDVTGLEAALKWVIEPSARARERFEAEIRAVAAMSHPNLVVVYDVGSLPAPLWLGDHALPAESPWFAMEVLPGAPVVQVHSWARAREVLASILAALAHAHARGWVHCDLKPDNVLADAAGRVVVTDFGVARTLDPNEPARSTGGTPEFMAPEQLFVQEWQIGPWTDLFATGLLAWVLCTGASPVPYTDVEELRRFHTHPLPRLAAPFAVPAGLVDWVARLLHPEPAGRFQSAAEALAALGDLEGARRSSLPGWRQSVLPEPVRLGGQERGLGLVRRREAPLVGRGTEQDVLWAELLKVIEGGRGWCTCRERPASGRPCCRAGCARGSRSSGWPGPTG
jgi:serine/threonine protein kinase